MARQKAKALPPKMITVYAEILQETEKAILVRCDDEADGEWLPKSQIKYSGERGDTGVEIEIPELLADEKGFFDGMGRPEVEVAPAEPEQPETVTFFGVRNFDEDTEDDIYFEVHSSDEENSVVEFFIPKTHIISEGQDSDYPEEEGRRYIEISVAHAIEAGMMEAPEESAEAPSDPETPAGKRAFGDNVKWIKEEKITVSQPLTESEKARLADEMSALDKEIEALKNERAEVSNRLKKLADAKEEERLTLSKMIEEGELRTFSCDCLKDYSTGEMVWTEAYPPYSEVQRRKMTKEEMQPSLLEYSEKMNASAPTEAEVEGETEPSEDDGTSFDESEALDVDAVADGEGVEGEAPAEDEGEEFDPVVAATKQGQSAGMGAA